MYDGLLKSLAGARKWCDGDRGFIIEDMSNGAEPNTCIPTFLNGASQFCIGENGKT